MQRLRIKVDPERYADAKSSLAVSAVWLVALLAFGMPADYWWQRLMLFVAVPVGLLTIGKIPRLRRLKPRSLREELEWTVSDTSIHLTAFRNGEEAWRHTASFEKGCDVRPGFAFHDDKPDGASDRYEVFVETRCANGAQKHAMLTPSDTLLQMDRTQVIQLMEMAAKALGKEAEARKQIEPWQRLDVMPAVAYQEGKEYFVFGGRTLRFDDIAQERHWRTKTYTNGVYEGTSLTLELTLVTGERLQETVGLNSPAAKAWLNLTRTLEQWRGKQRRGQLEKTGETAFDVGSKRIIIVKGPDTRAFLEHAGRRTQIAKVLLYYSYDEWNYVFLDDRGLRIATATGMPPDLDAMLDLLVDSGVSIHMLDRSPMLSLWLRRLGFNTAGERPIQGVFLTSLARLWWRLLTPLALIYYLLFGPAFAEWDESQGHFLTPAERWLGTEPPEWLELSAEIILVGSAAHLFVLLLRGLSYLTNRRLESRDASRLKSD